LNYQLIYTNALSSANFIGCVVGFLNVWYNTPRRLLLAASLSFESEWYYSINQWYFLPENTPHIAGIFYDRQY
jgi:hypothetical protein